MQWMGLKTSLLLEALPGAPSSAPAGGRISRPNPFGEIRAEASDNHGSFSVLWLPGSPYDDIAQQRVWGGGHRGIGGPSRPAPAQGLFQASQGKKSATWSFKELFLCSSTFDGSQLSKISVQTVQPNK